MLSTICTDLDLAAIPKNKMSLDNKLLLKLVKSKSTNAVSGPTITGITC